jgi:PKD repeat protein
MYTGSGTPDSYLWDFTDKKISTHAQTATNIYKAGKYTVSLTVENANGYNTKRYVSISE